MVRVTSQSILIVGVMVCIVIAGCTGGPASPPGGTGTSPGIAPPSSPTPGLVTPSPVPSYYAVTGNFFPSGWMGDTGDIALDVNNNQPAHSGASSIRIVYTPKNLQGVNWAGIYWQYPENNLGDNSSSRNLTGKRMLTFWAKGEKGGERAEFKVGGIGPDKRYPDSIQPAATTGVVSLTPAWQQYSIDLSGKDLHHVIGGFCWVTNTNQNPNGATIYLDDIQFE